MVLCMLSNYTFITNCLNFSDRHVLWLLHSKHTPANGQCCIYRWCIQHNIAQKFSKNLNIHRRWNQGAREHMPSVLLSLHSQKFPYKCVLISYCAPHQYCYQAQAYTQLQLDVAVCTYVVTHFQCFLNLAIILPFSPSGSISSIFGSLMNTICMNFYLDSYVLKTGILSCAQIQ